MTIVQQPENNVFGLSPMIYNVYDSNYTDAGFKYTADVYIWIGDISTLPSVTFSLQRSPNTSGYGVFEISGLLNSYFALKRPDNDELSEYHAVNVAVKFNYANTAGGSGTTVTSDTVQAHEGYYNQNNTINQNFDGDIFMTSSTHYFSGGDQWLAIKREAGSTVTKVNFSNGGDSVDVALTSPVTTSQDTVTLISVYASTSSYPPSSWTATLRTAADVQVGDSLECIYVPPCKYELVPILFINKFGTWDYIIAQGKRIDSKTYTRQEYSRDNIEWNDSLISRNVPLGNYATNNTLIRSELILNTGFLTEDNKMDELFRSRVVYINSNPYILKDTSLQIKTYLNDKLINYTLNLKAGYDD